MAIGLKVVFYFQFLTLSVVVNDLEIINFSGMVLNGQLYTVDLRLFALITGFGPIVKR